MFEQIVAKKIAEQTTLEEQKILELIEIPPDETLGDYAFPCFLLAKELKKAPVQIAQELAEKITDKLFVKVEAKGPYINFFIEPKKIVERAANKEPFSVNNKKVVIEYSAPNIAKLFGIGHLRSTIIGNALANCYEFVGWEVVRINHLGDWGTQFGKIIAAYKKWPVNLEEEPVKKLHELYVRFHKEAEEDEELAKLGQEEFKKLEEGDIENRKLWTFFKEVSLKEFEKMYARLGVRFDFNHGESFYEDKMQVVVDELREKGLLEESEGAQIVDLEDVGINTPAIILKSDGTTIYLTRDLAAAKYRYDTFSFDRMLYEVGNEQALHFKQVFAILKKMGCSWSDSCVHVAHGLYRFPEGKMSTRKGKTILIEEVLEQSVSRCKKVIEEKNPGRKNNDLIAEQVGIGAIMFFDLRSDRNNDIVFDWDTILNTDGDSGPYLQYTHARLKSIARKSDKKPKINYELLTSPEEVRVAKRLSSFNQVVLKVTESNKPHLIAQHLLDLAQESNTWYQKHRVVQEDKELEAARLAFIELICEQIKQGLSLLGIAAPEEM